MKLYSRSQLVKSSLLGVLAGVVIALASTAYFSLNTKSQENSGTSSESGKSEVSESEDTLSVSEKNMFMSGEVSSLAKTSTVSGNSSRFIEEKPVTVAKSYDSAYTQDEQQNIFVYEKCNEAVVNITTQVMGINWFLEPVVQEGGSGSGSIIDKRGYVVTNVHVISNASKINISLHDGTSYEGTVIGKDAESDIAVIKFNPPDNVTLKTIDFGDSNNLKVGQKVIAIGNPFALERTMTTGIISGLGRPIQESKNVIIRNMIQTDAAINPGNSGGPLLDTNGKMVGINTMIISNSGSSAGVGFAVPVSTARRVVDDLIKYRKVNRGILKITPVQMTSSIARYAGLSINTGILVSSVERGSSTEKSGILGGTEQVQYGSRFNPTTIYLGGDIITGIDNISVRTYADYTSALEAKRPGDTVTVTVFRNNEYKKLKVTLDGKDSQQSHENVQSETL
ncbi:trypsin-like peptidase domain-containing protein [uncultured Treponema sp.]|uniref:S1C family serine protease n=1 Tax=uncultured Treponema sp. TaxID=162155 RepID=UPI0025EC008F|nr:trypsin-like peptidase domain-containing protein [uncultured Treponema sp.]